MLYALREDSPDADRLRTPLRGPVTDDDDVAEALALLRASGGIAAAKQTVQQYAAQARAELAELPDLPGGARWLRWWTTRLTGTVEPNRNSTAPQALLCRRTALGGPR